MEVQLRIKSKGLREQTFEYPEMQVIVKRYGSIFIKSCLICKTSSKVLCPPNLMTRLKDDYLKAQIATKKSDCYCQSQHQERCEWCSTPYPSFNTPTFCDSWGKMRSEWFCNQHCADLYCENEMEMREKSRIEELLLD